MGENTLRGGHAGLQVEEGRSLTITAESTGSLTVIGATGKKGSAGIGAAGDTGGKGGNITINGGVVTATGGDSPLIVLGEANGGPGISGSTVTFLWRAEQSPVVNFAMSFADVDAEDYYAEAVRWAVSEGVTAGTGAASFSPGTDCTRAQIVTLLYRCFGEQMERA